MDTAPKAATHANPTGAERVAAIRFNNFRTAGRIVGVHISEDGTELWSHGLAKTHYPVDGARAHIEDDGHVIVFVSPAYELAIRVRSNASRHARGFAAQFNTWMKNR